jgi:hypothetical protein
MAINKQISETLDPASHTQKANVTVAHAQGMKHETNLIAIIVHT